MDSAKAKQAKTKAKAHAANKMQSDAVNNPQAMEQMVMQEQQHRQLMAQAGHLLPINPEVQASQISLQTPTINPYHVMGSVPANYYNPGNVINGGFVPGS
jgi:hypothetical protein